MMLEFKALRSSFERFIFYLLCIIHIIYLNKLFITVNFFKSWGTNFTDKATTYQNFSQFYQNSNFMRLWQGPLLQ